MLTLARVVDLYVDVDAPGGSPCLLDAAGSPRASDNPVLWVLGDAFEIRLHFRKRPSTLDGIPEVVEQPASWAIVVAGKTTGIADPALVFSTDAFSKVVTDDDVYYAAALSLATEGLTTAMAAVAVGQDIEFLVDIENQDAGNTARLTYQFTARIRQQVYANEADPEPEAPLYPAPAALLVKIGGSAALVQGQDYLVVSGLGCASAPAIVITTVRKPSGGANLFATVDGSTVTTAGFRADLSGAPPAAGYYLDFFVVL
jgi:hypothetical protein